MAAVESNELFLNQPFLDKWIALLEQLINGVERVYIELQGGILSSEPLVMTIPQGLGHREELILAAKLARQSAAPVTGTGQVTTDGFPTIRIACPLHLNSTAAGVIVVEVNAPLSQQSSIIKSLEMGETWLNYTLNPLTAPASATTLGSVIDAGSAYTDYSDALTAVLAQLANQIKCTRVSLGRLDKDRLHVEAVSGVSDLSRRSARNQAAEDVLQEAVDAASTVLWPTNTEAPSTSALRSFVKTYQLAGACAVPLTQDLKSPIVFFFEFVNDEQWNEQVKTRCDEAARVAAPLLEWKREQHRPLWRRFLALGNEGLQKLTGNRHRHRKILLIVAMVAFVFFATGQSDHRIPAPAVVEGAIQRAVVAPYDGFIEQAKVRAGQTVAAGDLLASMDDRKLQEERRRLQAEKTELSKQHRQAMAGFDRSEASIVEARMEQAQARLQLVKDQLQRLELRSPFDGIVISGDWSRSLGAPISRGDILFEIAPLDDYRISLNVSDRDISGLKAGQIGEVTFTAQPRQPLAVTITGITTIASTDTAEPGFRVEAEPSEARLTLRPGMEGLAKISVGERQRWWIWTHTLTDWIRLQLWRWMP